MGCLAMIILQNLIRDRIALAGPKTLSVQLVI